jgi:hypothetical protein
MSYVQQYKTQEILVCPLCGTRLIRLGIHLKRTHGLDNISARIIFPEIQLETQSFIDRMRSAAKLKWENPDSVQNSPEFKRKIAEIARNNQVKPNSVFRTTEHMVKRCNGLRRGWKKRHIQEMERPNKIALKVLSQLNHN